MGGLAAGQGGSRATLGFTEQVFGASQTLNTAGQPILAMKIDTGGYYRVQLATRCTAPNVTAAPNLRIGVIANGPPTGAAPALVGGGVPAGFRELGRINTPASNTFQTRELIVELANRDALVVLGVASDAASYDAEIVLDRLQALGEHAGSNYR